MKPFHYALVALWLTLGTGTAFAGFFDQDADQLPDPAPTAPAPLTTQDPDLPPPLPAPPGAGTQPSGSPPAPAVPSIPSPEQLQAAVAAAQAAAQAQAPVVLAPPAPPRPPVADPLGCTTADCGVTGDKSGSSKSKTASIPIGPPAQRALAESHAWAENPYAMPLRDSGGRVVFGFSESAPTIVCMPLHVCDIELQAGELVQGPPHIGDAVRWKISPALSGSEDRRVTHLIVKPTEVGLDTNLIVPTDRRTYHLRLVSSYERYVSSVGFFYPDDDAATWKEMGKPAAGSVGSAALADMPTVAVNRLNFNYKIKVVKGKPGFKPLRAMDDGYHTYIAMNEDMPQGEAPALIGISPSGEEQMLNYRLKGNIFVVDGTVTRLALISGVGGDQQRIEISRQTCQRRGWLGICWDPKE
jgi:type IV secretion system protein TrbG